MNEGDDADQKFNDAEITSSLLSFWKTLNFPNPTTTVIRKLQAKLAMSVTFLIVGGFSKFKVCQKANEEL